MADISRLQSQKVICMACYVAGISQGVRPANERRRYFVTTSLIGWMHT